MDVDKLIEDVAIEINQSSMWLSMSSRTESYQEVRDVFTALEQLGYEIRAVSPAPSGELRERIAKALQAATDDTDGWITRLSDEQALAIADAVLNGDGER